MGRNEHDTEYLFIQDFNNAHEIDERWPVAWEKVVLPKYKQDQLRMERFKLMWKYMLCMYPWFSKGLRDFEDKITYNRTFRWHNIHRFKEYAWKVAA